MSGIQAEVSEATPKVAKTRDLSIIIVSFNTYEMLRTCLKTSMGVAGDLDVEFIVVDNNSADGSADMVAEEFPRVQLIRNPDNRGFATACNQGIRWSRGEYTLLLNSDAFLQPNTLCSMVGFMRQHPKAGVCGAQLIEGDGAILPPFIHFPTPLSSFFNDTRMGKIFPRSRHIIRPEISPQALSRPMRVDWVSGACFMVRKKAIEEVGLLDEEYFLYFEETDWCRRMANQNWDVWYLPDAKVRHIGGSSLDDSASQGPFESYHARHMLKSRRRHMRTYYGVGGMLLNEFLDLSLYSAQYLKNTFRRGPEARAKASIAIAAIACILGFRKM